MNGAGSFGSPPFFFPPDFRKSELVKPSTLALALLLAAAPALADYDSDPALAPEKRCASIPPSDGDPGGAASVHCQRMIWDLRPATKLGFVAAAAPLPEKRVPRFPGG